MGHGEEKPAAGTNGENLETRIIEAAKQLFAERGYDNTSMSDIAATLGVNRPTLHYYFRTKEKMFAAVFGLLLDSFVPRIESILTERIPFIEKLERLTDEYLDIYLAHPFLPRFVLGEMHRDVDQLLAVMTRLDIDRYAVALQKSYLGDVERGTIRPVPPVVVITTFFGQLTFPFLAKNLLVRIFLKDEEGFQAFIRSWRTQIISQMRALLVP